MICPNCHEKVSNNSKFCKNCGFNLLDGEDEEISLVEQNKQMQQIQRQQLRVQTMQARTQQKQLQVQQKQLRLQQKQMKSVMKCPKCGSTSLSAHKKGFGIGKAVVGASILGPIGLVAGNIGAKKVRVTCMKCGHKFWAGKR